MAYTKQTWTDGSTGGTPLSAARLNHVEDGVEAAAAAADAEATRALAAEATKVNSSTYTAGLATKQALQQVAATVSASGAAVVNKHNPVDATGAARSLSLPTAQAEGTQISVEKVDSSSNAVSITGNIRGVGSSTIALTFLSESLMLRADSAGSWWPIAGHRTKASIDGVYMQYVGTYATPISSAGQARPTTSGPVYWIMALGVTPTNAAGGDLIYTKSS